jgi:predicted O-linked N-acetylglucosamine transferase (SPINDLY family)
VYYEPLRPKPVSVTREELQLRRGATVFWCGQALHKYLPQYDDVFPRIAREAGDCQFVFIEFFRSRHVTGIFRERLDQAFAAFGLNARDHCVFLPGMNSSAFAAAIGQCDIVLDSIGWSGCNSILESLIHDLPIVTLRGDLMRGRHTAAILQMMDATELVTGSVDDYAAAAVRLARDEPWRKAAKAKIAANKHRLYRDRACITALEEFLDRVVRDAGQAV